MTRTIERIMRTAMLAVAFMFCATSAWAYSVGDTVEWSNTNTTAAIYAGSPEVINECHFDFKIPASEGLPEGSVVKIKSITLASLNDDGKFHAEQSNYKSDPGFINLNGVKSAAVNGVTFVSNNYTGDFTDKIASSTTQEDYALKYTFSSDCLITVGNTYSAQTGSNTGAVGTGIVFLHPNGNCIYGGSTDKASVRYVQSPAADGLLTPYASTDSTTGMGNGKVAKDGGYYPVYVVEAEVVAIKGTTPDFIWDDVATSHGCSSPTLSIAKWVSSVPSCTTMRVGPNITDWVYEEATPYWSSAPTAVSSDFSIALYGDVSQMPSSKRAVMLCLGKGASNTTLLIYREGSSIAAGYYRSGVLQGTAASIANVTTPGYRLIVCTVKRSTGELDLYVGDDSGVLQHGSGDAGAAQTIDSAWQIKNVFGGVGNYGYGGDTFTGGAKFVFAKLLGFDSVLSAATVSSIFSDYPRTDGTKITADIDPALGGELTVYTSSATGNQYLGGSYGTVTIPEGNTVTVPHMRFLNREYTTDSVTLNINGTVNVTSVSDTYNVYYGGDYSKYKGILFGHYKGTGTYNVNSTGSLIATNAWLQMVYSAGQQDLSINGGTVRVKGIYSDKANSASVTLKDGGVLEVNEIISNGQDFTRNFKSGTFRITADATETRAINFSAVGGYYTTLDPYGHTLTLGSGSVTGSGAIKVNSSAAGETKGKVVFNNLTTAYSGSITIVAGSTATLKAGNYAGTFNVEEGATLEIDPGAGNAYTCAASFTGAGNVVVKSGTVTFTGSNTLDNAITVEANAIAVAAVTGSEGEFQVLSGATLRLYVTTDQYRYEGNVFKGTNNGTVEYYHGTQSDYSDYVKITDSNSLNGNNLLPYYQIWKVVGEATEGEINTAANWPGAGAVPTVRGDETYGNAAFYVASGTVTVNIDATMNFSEIQIYGAGTVIFKSDGTHYLSANYLSMTAGVNVQISGGEALKLSNGEIISAQPSQTITINSGAKLSLDGVSCANRIICNGTLETAGTTTLSGSNQLNDYGSLNVIGGKCVIGFQTMYCGGSSHYANVNIANGAELEITTDNPIFYNGACNINVKGTLTLDQSMNLGNYTPINIYPGGEIDGVGTIKLGGNGERPNSTIKMFSAGGDASALASISCPIELTSSSDIATIIVEDGVTLACGGNITAASGKSLTKQGAGTLDLTAITPSSPMAIDAGKVVADEVPTATITINENGTFVLKDKAWAKGNADCFRGSGTLELYAATMEYGHDVEGVSFSGIVKVSNVTGKQNNFTGTAAMFASAPEFILNADKTHLGGGYYNNNDEHPFEVKNLSGSGNFKSQWDGYAHSYIIKTTQTKDTVFSGSFESNHSTGDRVMNLTVVGDGSGTVHSLTLTKGQNTSSTDTAEAASTLKVSDGAKVVFTSTGGWGYGNVLVGNGGWLQSTNATAVTKLTLQTGSHLVLPTKTSQLTGVSTISASGTIKVHIADDTVPDVETYLVDWSAAGLANAPGGNFLLVGTAAEHFALEKDTTGLKVVEVVCTLTTNGETIGYTSLNDALTALYMARNADKDAYITIMDGSTPSAETIATWADASIGWDSENGKFYVIVVAQIGNDKYLSLADAITAAADSGDTIVLKIDCSENVNLGGKSVTFDESSATFTGTFTGNGTLTLASTLKSADPARWAEGWTGTVVLPAIGSIAGDTFSFNNYGNSRSTVRVTTIGSGWVKNEVVNPVIDIETSLTLTDFSAGNTNTFPKITGSGSLSLSCDASAIFVDANNWYSNYSAYFLVNDMSEFSGSVSVSNVGLAIGDEKPAYKTAGDKIILNSGKEATVASGKTWTADGGFVVNGTLNVNGTLASSAKSVSGSGTVVFTGKLPPSDAAANAWWKNANWTGKVEIKNYTETNDEHGIIVLNNYGNNTSAVALNCVTSTMYAVSGSYPAVTLREIEIGEGGWSDTEKQFSNVTMLYTAKLSGTGTITVKTSGSGTVKFIGDHTFDGSVAFGDSTGKRVAFMKTSSDELPPAVTAKSIVVAEGVEMSVASGKTWTANGGFVINGTLNVAGTLASSAATAVSGTGTVVFDGKLPSPTGDAWWKNDAWDGTVWLKNQEVAGFDGTTCGNEGSTVRFTGVTGYLQTSSYGGSTYVHTVPLELVDDGDTVAFTYNNGYGGNLVKINTLKGTGTLKTQNDGSGEHIYIVDGSNFTGVFNLTTKYVYVGGSQPDYSVSTNPNGKLEIRSGVTMTVPSGKTWTADGGFVINGTLNVNGTLASSHASKAVSGSGKVVFTGRLPSQTGDAWWKNAAWTGKVELKNYTRPYDTTVDYGIIVLNNYGNMNSAVALNCVTSTMFAVSGNSKYPPVILKEIEIGEGGWTDIADGSFGADMLYTANLTGHGLITVKTGGNGTVKFIGNHTFDGSVAFDNSTGKRVAFMKTSSDELPSTVTAKSIVVAGGLDMSIASGKTWTADDGGIMIDGSLTVLTSQKDTATSGTILAYKDGDSIGSTDDAATGKTIYVSVTPIAISNNQASQGDVTVIGAQSITGTGGAYMSSLTIKDGATLTYDPVITPLRVESAPVFVGTGKLKLASRYAGVTCGKFHLVSYPSSLNYSAERLQGLVDSSSFNNETYTVSEVEVSLDADPTIVSDATKSSYYQLVLKVGNYDSDAKDVSIAQFGDSITEGIFRNGYRGTPNYRIPLMQLLEAYGYRPEARGYREVGSMDANGILADDNYKWHTGISAQRIYTGGSSLRAGFMESIEAHLEQVGVTDIITLKIGTNDALGNESADNMFEGWSNLVWKIVRMRPTSKIVVCTPIIMRSGENKAPGLRTKIAEYVAKTAAQGGFPDGQVTIINGETIVTGDANDYLDNVHPNWNGHMKLANEWLPAVTNAFESMKVNDVIVHAADVYTAQPAVDSAEDVDDLAVYRAGYVKLATFTNFNAKVSAWGENPYVSVNDTYKDMPMRRVAYFVARKTKASLDSRYVWVDMDADETAGNTLAAFGMPTNASVNGVVNNLHIYSNSSAIENVAPTVSGVKGTLMRTEKGVSGAAAILDENAPAGVVWDTSKNLFDWNDSIDRSGAWGVLSVARKFDIASPTTPTHRQLIGAQMLFDFNGFNVSGNNNALGIGNFAVHGRYDDDNSTLQDQTLNWTFKVAMPTMDASALDSGVIEIWGKPAWGTIFSVY